MALWIFRFAVLGRRIAMRSFQLLCRLRSFVVSAKITLTCFFALIGLAVFVLGTAHSPAQAQYPGGGSGGYPGGGSGGYPGSSGSWVPCDSSGNPLPSGDRRLNSDGGAYLTPSGKQPNLGNTYPVPDSAAQWWFGAFSPNKYSANSGSEYGPPSLSLNGYAGNTTTDEYGSGPVCYYDPNNYGGDRPDNIPLPPDLLGSAHGDTSDTLTAYFVWTGPDPAPSPANFIVHTSVSAGASISQASGLSATATASLGGDSVTATAGNAGLSVSQAKDGYHVVQASVSGLVAQVPMSGSVSVDSSNSLRYGSWVDSAAGPGSSGPGTYYYSGPGNGYTSASDNATALATAYPVTINLDGAINVNGTQEALTGQQITATLKGIPSGVKVTSYTWSFTGGTGPNPIKNWDGTNNIQQLFLLTSIDKTGTDTSGNGIAVNPLSFYDQAADTVTVKCAVNLTFPDGTTGSVTPTSVPLTFLKPTAVWNAHSTDPNTGPVFDQTQMGYIEKWDATITVPSPFSGGSGCFAQIVTPTVQFQRSPLNNQPSLCYLKVPQTDIYGNTSYVLPTTGLDTGFPYRIGSSTYQYYPQGYQWDVSSQGISTDTPFVSFSIGASDNGGNNWYTAFASYTFTTWLMYQPSTGGTGSPIWVPLQRVDWSWTGNVVKNKATGQWNAATNGSPPVSGQTSDPGVTTDQPPQWSNVNVGDTVLRP